MMGGACGMHGELEMFIQGFVRETSETGDHLEVLGVNEREILRHTEWSVWYRNGTKGGLL